MDFKFGVLLVISAYFCTSHALPPCTCTRNYKPVCGSNGETYSNKCLLECVKFISNADLTLVREGRCEDLPVEDCICPFNYLPVCGTDGTTYSNQCSLDCKKKGTAGLELRHTGSCEDLPPVEDCVCTFNYLPVCGTDGTTYSNQCSLDCKRKNTAGLELRHTGECAVQTPTDEPLCTCTREKKPVCGSDGNTYSNDCLLNCATAKNHKLSIASYGPCEDKVKVVEPKLLLS